jgi:hypothetical protein
MSTRPKPRVSRNDAALTPGAQLGLTILRKAFNCAVQLNVSPWQFAVPAVSLRAQGLDETDLRFLCASGLAESGVEEMTPDSREREFRPLANLAMPESACLIATPQGLECSLGGPGSPEHVIVNGRPHAPAPDAAPQTPSWIRKTGKLWWGNRVIKSLRRHAKRQRLVLAAFEEAGWPRRIDDPLPRDAGVNPKERLRQTVRHLNKRNAFRAIEFRVDEDYRGIHWEPV